VKAQFVEKGIMPWEFEKLTTKEIKMISFMSKVNKEQTDRVDKINAMIRKARMGR
jgi:hypothetical protein